MNSPDWRSWKHSPIYSYRRGRCQVSCSCGKFNSRWYDTYAEAHAGYTLHVGLREERRKAHHG